MPNFAIPITVDTIAALALIHVAELDNGTFAWVDATDSVYVLHKVSALAANGTTIIAPATGSPIAGAATARWIQLVGGSGTSVQKIYAENQDRTTVLIEPAPGGVFATVLSAAIITTTGSFLDITASLSALTDGGAASTNTEAVIRILVDGVSSGLGASSTTVNDNANLEPFVTLTLEQRVAVTPGPHLVELQWTIQGDGAADKSIGFLVPDQDGCSMFVEEVA